MDRTECGTIDADPPLIRIRHWKIPPRIRWRAVAAGGPVKWSRETVPSASPHLQSGTSSAAKASGIKMRSRSSLPQKTV